MMIWIRKANASCARLPRKRQEYLLYSCWGIRSLRLHFTQRRAEAVGRHRASICCFTELRSRLEVSDFIAEKILRPVYANAESTRLALKVICECLIWECLPMEVWQLV